MPVPDVLRRHADELERETDEIDLPRDELGERLAIDPVLKLASFGLIRINTGTAPKAGALGSLPTRRVQLCLDGCLCYSVVPEAGSRPVSRAQRSTLLQRQTADRPSLPRGLGDPDPLASTLTRCGEMPSRLAMSTAITSSVRGSTCTPVTARHRATTPRQTRTIPRRRL